MPFHVGRPGLSEIVVFPVREADFALYLQHVGDSAASKSAVEEAVNSIGWVEQLAGFPPVADSPFVRMVLDGMQCRLAKPKARKEPMSSSMMATLLPLLWMFDWLQHACWHFQHFCAMMSLPSCDAVISHLVKNMSVHIASSKTSTVNVIVLL